MGFLLLSAVTGTSVSAQSAARDHIEKAWKDPKRPANEAKAERMLHEKYPVLSDTTGSSVPALKKKTAKRKKGQ